MKALVAAVVAVAIALTVYLLARSGDESVPTPVLTPPAADPPTRPQRTRSGEDAPKEGDAEPVPFVSRSLESSGDKDEWTRRVTVAVTSAADKTPVQGAVVRVLRRFSNKRFETATTGADGVVTLDAPNRSVVIVHRTGFVTQSLVPDEGRVESAPRLDVALVPGSVLAGRVVRAGTTAGVPDAEVYAWDARSGVEIDFDAARFDHDESTGVRTGADGTFAFSALPPHRDVILAVRANGLASVTKRIPAGGPSAPLVIELGGGASVTGFVRDAAGKPIEGTDVYAVERGDEFLLRIPEVRDLHENGVKLPPHATSAADGSYRIEGLATPAAYVVTGARERWDRGIAEVAELLAPGATAQRDVVVYDRCRIRGTCLGPDGQPVDFDDFEIRLPSGERYENPFANGSSSDGSTFTTTDVVPGEYVVVVSAKGPWPPVSVPVTVKAKGATEIEARFRTGATLSGVVTDETGKPIEGVKVCADGHSVESGADGTFRIEGVRAGPVAVSARTRDDIYSPRQIENAETGGTPLSIVMSPGAAVSLQLELHRSGAVAFCIARAARGTMWVANLSKENGSSLCHRIQAGIPFDLTIRDGPGECHAVTIRDLCVPPGKTLELGHIAFRAMRTVRGVVLDPDGSAVAGAVVSRVDPTGASDSTDTTDASGAFELRGATPDALLVTIDAAGFPRLFRLLNSETPERIRLEPGVMITGRLFEGDGAPSCCRDLVIGPGGEARSKPASPWWEAPTDSMGEFRVLVPPGRHVLYARRVVYRSGPNREFDDTPVTEFDAALPGPVRVEARMK
jgi:hypothetical protein